VLLRPRPWVGSIGIPRRRTPRPREERRDPHERAGACAAEDVVAVAAVVPPVRQRERRAALPARRAGRVGHELPELGVRSWERLCRVLRKQ
jgi:hypothetical protein